MTENTNTTRTHRIILASGSPRRLDLLKTIGIIPDLICKPNLNEAALKGELPIQYAERMAFDKAKEVFSILQTQGKITPSDYIIAADTVVAVGRRILHKPTDINEARSHLQLLSGRRHHVYGAIALFYGDQSPIKIKRSHSQVIFKRLSHDEIESYLSTGQWQDKAGGYAIQGLAASLIRYIQGSYSNIVGLDLYLTHHLLSTPSKQNKDLSPS